MLPGKSRFCALAALTVAFVAPVATADEASNAASANLQALSAARHDQRVAELRLKQYSAEYSLTLHRLDADIRMAKAELAMLERQVQQFGRSSVFRYSSAFSWTLEQARLSALAVKLKLEDLEHQKLLHVRGRADQQQLLESEYKSAALRVAALQRELYGQL